MARPWYKWYPSNWLSSETRLRMTATERSIYRDLLDICYQEGSIPNDERILTNLAAVSRKEFTDAWPEVSKKFVPFADNRLTNPKCVEELARCAEMSAAKALAGRRGGERRARKQQDSSICLDSASNSKSGSASTESKQNSSDADADADADTPLTPQCGASPTWTAFERIAERYPNRVEVDLAAQIWLSYVDTGVIADAALIEIEAGLSRWLESDQWTRDDGRYVPSLAKWLRDKRWLDHPPASAEAKATKRSAKRSSEGIDPNAIWIAPWEQEGAA
ncbi:MAG: YdaU family protein [Bryobacterales bacterium]|nr:YdaU family protein [Bryobacterales bacterium]